jgi:hypothetical protein
MALRDPVADYNAASNVEARFVRDGLIAATARFACLLLLVALFHSTARSGDAVSVRVKSRKSTKQFGYSPAQATGEPELQAAGDNSHAWTPQPADGGVEWLKVEFEQAVQIAEVRIRESNNAGFVVKVVAYAEDGKEVVVFEGDDPAEEGLSDLVVEPTKKVTSRSIKIFVDTAKKPGWEEIDAVELVGVDGSRQWAVDATASSSYGAQTGHLWGANAPGAGPRPWSAEQATGEPNTLNPGDAPTAWAPEEVDAGLEWLQVNYKRAVVIAEVRIRESFHPGAISRVTAVVKDKGEVVLWEGNETPAGELCDFVVKPDRDVEAQSIRIYVDTARVSGWTEIDAVELVGKDGARQWASSASATSSYGSTAGAAGNDLVRLRGHTVTIRLDGNFAIKGRVVRVGRDFLTLEDEKDREKLINRQKIIVIEVGDKTAP